MNNLNKTSDRYYFITEVLTQYKKYNGKYLNLYFERIDKTIKN